MASSTAANVDAGAEPTEAEAGVDSRQLTRKVKTHNSNRRTISIVINLAVEADSAIAVTSTSLVGTVAVVVEEEVAEVEAITPGKKPDPPSSNITNSLQTRSWLSLMRSSGRSFSITRNM
jgi:hypothetical protein